MNWDNEDFEAFIRRANPVPPEAEPAPTLRQLALRDQIMRPAARRRVPRSRAWAALWAPLAALAVVIAVVLTVPPAEEARAVTTPKPLDFRDEGKTLEDVTETAQRNLARSGGPVHPERAVESTGWYYQVDAVDSDAPRRVISPEVTTLEWNEDLSGSTRTVAGKPYWADGGQGDFPRSTATPGTLLWEVDFAPGEFQSPVVTAPGAGDTEVLAMLRAYGLESERSAFEVMNATETALQYWTLTNDQHQALLQAILRTDDARLLGSATDRAGRPIAGIAATLPSGSAELHLLVSQDTGRIVGAETYTLEADHPFPANAIVSYRIWDLSPQ
ncbi:hypothetical protein [Microbacterium sulfonylureivorans]|uniref:hypothetical protein n=1 Tax=Microbacterium sulfonylureivorans TaxID=2486854 RepID=UPI000FDC6637|nr:hypothetical protein [Microbacterium sulfonylureivorans]